MDISNNDEAARQINEQERRITNYIQESGNPILIEWWEYRNNLLRRNDFSAMNTFSLALSIFTRYIQYLENRDKLESFVKAKQNGFVSGWQDFSKQYLISNDFLWKSNPEISKQTYLKYEKKTFQMLDDWYNGKEKKHSGWLRKIFSIGNRLETNYLDEIGRVVHSEEYEFIEHTYFKYMEPQETNNKLIGFNCALQPSVVMNVYDYMIQNEYLEGNLEDFKAIFSDKSKRVMNPLIWLIINERGRNSGRGNQTALFVFIKIMLGNVSNADLRKSKDLFHDHEGIFINGSLIKPDKNKINRYGFEDYIKDLIEKADQ